MHEEKLKILSVSPFHLYLLILIQILFPSTVAWCYTEVHFPRFVEIRPDVLNVVINP